MHRVPAFVAALVALSSGGAMGHQPDADPIDIATHTPARPYIGQQIIQVIPTTQAQLDAALDLAQGVWSERIGIGPIELQVHSESIDAYRDLGLNPVVLIDDLQRRADLDWQRIVETNRLDAARPIGQRGGLVHDESWFTNFKQLNQIHAYINDLAIARPDIASVSSIGTSIEGRDIPAITITAPDAPGNAGADRPVILWNGCQHAREWISPMTVTYLASRFVDGYGSDTTISELLENARIIIVPVVNPDGYTYSWSDERFWRKNRRDISGSSEFGVDLNRNWGYEWGGEGASPSPGSDTYHGVSSFSEPETVALRDFSLSLGDDLVSHIDYHSYSQLILWPFGYADGVITPEPDRTMFDSLAVDVSNSIFDVNSVNYTAMQSVDLYPAAGTCSDWFYGDHGATSFTIELRPTGGPGFDLPPEEILPTAHENLAGAILFAQRTTQLISFSGTHPSNIDADTVVPINITITDGMGTLDASSPVLITQIDNGTETTTPMNNKGAGVYSADLPPTPCGSVVSYRFVAQTIDGDERAFPSNGTIDALAEYAAIIVEDTMETDTGWVVGAAGDTATTGVWERANPQATDAQPEDDHTDAGTLCWITDADAGATLGANDIDGGATTLTSPILDASGITTTPVLAYHRWYSNNAGASPDADQMEVYLSNNDGASWTPLETVTENAYAWVEKRFVISDFIAPTDAMRVRFVASDFDEGSIVEAGVDDLQILAIGCDENPADLDGNGVLDIFDVFAYLDLYNADDMIADFTNDGILDIFDVFAFLKAFNAG